MATVCVFHCGTKAWLQAQEVSLAAIWRKRTPRPAAPMCKPSAGECEWKKRTRIRESRTATWRIRVCPITENDDGCRSSLAGASHWLSECLSVFGKRRTQTRQLGEMACSSDGQSRTLLSPQGGNGNQKPLYGRYSPQDFWTATPATKIQVLQMMATWSLASMITAIGHQTTSRGGGQGKNNLLGVRRGMRCQQRSYVSFVRTMSRHVQTVTGHVWTTQSKAKQRNPHGFLLGLRLAVSPGNAMKFGTRCAQSSALTAPLCPTACENASGRLFATLRRTRRPPGT